MSRWKPDARGRLEQAALDLFSAHGYEATTVAEIAAQAELTERTFYRHFTDKKDVLFPSDNPLVAIFAGAVAATPEATPPLEIVARALADAAPILEDRAEFARQRQSILANNPELREREVAKLAALASVLSSALSDRGVEEATAVLAAEIGITAFKVAFGEWVDDARPGELAPRIRQLLHETAQLAAGLEAH